MVFPIAELHLIRLSDRHAQGGERTHTCPVLCVLSPNLYSTHNQQPHSSVYEASL